MNSPAELAAVRHLVELGYEDPLDVAMRRAIEERGRQTQLARAQEWLDAGQVGDGVAALERLAEEATDWAPPHQRLAAAYFQAGRLQAARRELDWLELHAVEHVQLAVLRAAIDLAQRRLDAALEQVDYARHLGKVSPNLATAAPEVIAGEVHLRRGEFAAAEAAFRQAHQRWPTDAGSLAGLSGVALRRGEDEAAVDFALQALDANMHLPLAHYRLGAGLARLGMYDQARVALETFARMSPHRASPYRWLAWIALRQGDQATAAACHAQGRELLRARRAQRSVAEASRAAGAG